MGITEVATGDIKEVVIEGVEDSDYKALTKKRYSFPWKEWKGKPVYKLHISGEKDILEVMALEYFQDESRVEIKLLASSKENIGAGKVFEGIAGCLIAFAGREAIKKYADLACVSLLPKTKLKPHYMKKYGMLDAGWQLHLEGVSLINLVTNYFI